MSVLDIRIYPDPVLKQQAAPVTEFDSKLERLLRDMADTMYDADGIGLAAPQVGILQQIAVIDVSEKRDQVLHFINPVITERSGETPSEEGCLSIPEYRDTISRNTNITVQAVDPSGTAFELKADGLLAICLQHEIDHLNGVLFVDHLSRLKREFFKRWLKKQLLRE